MSQRICVVRAPVDAGVVNVGGRPGAAAGPLAIVRELERRDALQDVSVHALDVRNTTASLESDLAQLADLVARLEKTSDRILVLGGDNGITYAAALGMSRREP